jgi:hypothetical protein
MTDRRVFLVGFGIPDVKTISTLLQTTLRADFALPFPEIRYIKLIALVALQSPVQPRAGFDRQQYTFAMPARQNYRWASWSKQTTQLLNKH